jgi:hypothetical protein
MAEETFTQRWKRIEDELGYSFKFDDIPNKLHSLRDVAGILLLQKLAPIKAGRDAISAAEHDQFWLGHEPSIVAEKITDDEIRDLQRCGILYDADIDGFYCFP